MSGSQLNTVPTLPSGAAGAPVVSVAAVVPEAPVVPGVAVVSGLDASSSSSPQAARMGTDETSVSPPTTPADLEMNALRVYMFVVLR
jgi:hypothetical protein